MSRDGLCSVCVSVVQCQDPPVDSEGFIGCVDDLSAL